MRRLVIADIKSPVTDGKCVGHFLAVANNYNDVFGEIADTWIAGGPVYASISQGKWIRLPYNLYMEHESKLVNKIKYFINAYTLFKQCHDDVLVIQQGADATFFFACALLLNPRKNNSIYLIQYSTASLQGVLKRCLYKLATRKIDGIICPNDAVGREFGKPYCVVNDYLPKLTPVVDVPYADKQYDICILGRIEEEKGVVEVVSSLAKTKYRVIVAGTSSSETIKNALRKICQDASNITLRLEYVTNDEYNEYLSQSRFCVLNYSDEYSRRSSGVVFDMLYHHVPVIGKQCSALQIVADKELGCLYSDWEQCQLSEIITENKYNCYMSHIKQYISEGRNEISKLSRFLTIV